MIKKPIVAANWKMYKTPQEGVSFVSEISNLLLDKEKPTIIFCPSFTSLFHINENLPDSGIELGSQNVYLNPKVPLPVRLQFVCLRTVVFVT